MRPITPEGAVGGQPEAPKKRELVFVFAGNSDPVPTVQDDSLCWRIADLVMEDARQPEGLKYTNWEPSGDRFSKNFELIDDWKVVGQSPNASIIAKVRLINPPSTDNFGDVLTFVKPLGVDAAQNFHIGRLGRFQRPPSYYGYEPSSFGPAAQCGGRNVPSLSLRALLSDGVVQHDNKFVIVADDARSKGLLFHPMYFPSADGGFFGDIAAMLPELDCAKICIDSTAQRAVPANDPVAKAEMAVADAASYRYFVSMLLLLSRPISMQLQGCEGSDNWFRNAVADWAFSDVSLDDVMLNIDKLATHDQKTDFIDGLFLFLYFGPSCTLPEPSMPHGRLTDPRVLDNIIRSYIEENPCNDFVASGYNNLSGTPMEQRAIGYWYLVADSGIPARASFSDSYLVGVGKLLYYLIDNHLECVRELLGSMNPFSSFYRNYGHLVDRACRKRGFFTLYPPLKKYYDSRIKGDRGSFFTPFSNGNSRASAFVLPRLGFKMKCPIQAGVDILDDRHYRSHSSLKELASVLEKQIEESSVVLLSPNRFNIVDFFKPRYGLKEPIDLLNSTSDVRRSFWDLYSLMHAVKIGKPIFGICGGFQVIANAIGFDVDAVSLPQTFRGSKDDRVASPRFGGSVAVRSNHKQGVCLTPDNKILADELGLSYSVNPTTGYGDVMKDLRINNGKTILATQYHPEYNLAQDRDMNILEAFFNGETILGRDSPVARAIIRNVSKIVENAHKGIGLPEMSPSKRPVSAPIGEPFRGRATDRLNANRLRRCSSSVGRL